MTINTLTDAKCKAAKASEKPRKVFDGAGLFLHISPVGSKVWRVAYRLDGKQQTATLGEYPLISLADARTKRDDLRTRLANGEDPKAGRKSGRPAMTVEEGNNSYWATRADLSPAYLKKSKRAIEQYLYPKFKNRPLDGVSREDLMEVLRAVDAQGKSVYVRKIRLWTGMIYDWAVENSYASSNPAAQIDPKKAFSRAKVVRMPSLDLHEVPDFLQRLSLEGSLQSVLGCKLLSLTWLRTNELRTMRWDDVSDDLIRIPGERMKKEKDHLVPLSTQATDVLRELDQRRNGSEFVFPSDRRIDRPMSENSILYMLHRIGYKGRMCGHGWRSVGSTWANENGYNKDVIERQLAHTPADKVRSAYNRAEYLPQRTQMIQDWANWLDSCKVDTGLAQC